MVNHVTGLMGMPRRLFTTNYGGAEAAQAWEGLTKWSAIGGIVLFASAGFFVLVMVGTLLAGKKKEQPEIEWAKPLVEPAGGFQTGIWDRLGLWFAVAVILVIIAYAIPLYNHFQLERFGSPGFKPF
jgi:cytochrome c oxidase subunit 1